MPFIAKKIPFEHVEDTSGLKQCFENGEFTANQIVGIVGKTEGNGGVNDFSRILADRTLRQFLREEGCTNYKDIPIPWSGGCDGIIAPHMTVFAEVEEGVQSDEKRMVVSAAMSEAILPEEIGRTGMVEKVAAGVRKAMERAGITDPADVHFVQSKAPLLTFERIRSARSRGHTVVTEETFDSMAIANATAALGIGYALGEIDMPTDEQIAKDLSIYSSVASCSSGAELDEAQIILVGNKAGAGGDFAIGHSVMNHALDVGGIYDAIRNAGMVLPERPLAEDLGDAVVGVYLKCEADPSGRLLGRRLVCLNDSDVHWTRHSKAATGAVAAYAIGDPAVFCSVASLQQGPAGGGMVAAIIDHSKIR